MAGEDGVLKGAGGAGRGGAGRGGAAISWGIRALSLLGPALLAPRLPVLPALPRPAHNALQAELFVAKVVASGDASAEPEKQRSDWAIPNANSTDRKAFLNENKWVPGWARPAF